MQSSALSALITGLVSGMRDLLHRLGYVYKQTKAVPGKADDGAQQEFLRELLPAVLKEVEEWAAGL